MSNRLPHEWYIEQIQRVTLLTCLINGFGLAGNVISFIVFSRQAFSKSSSVIYFKTLCLVDSFVIFHFKLVLISLVTRIDFRNENDIVCKLFYLITAGTSPNPSSILTLLSIHLLISVSMTSRFRFYKNRRFQIKLIISVVLFNFLHAIYILKQASVKEIEVNNVTVRWCHYDQHTDLLPIAFLFLTTLIPFAIMISSTGFILRALLRSQNVLKRYQLGAITITRRYRGIKFGFNSVALNIIFLLLSAPIPLAFILTSNTTDYFKNEFIKFCCFAIFNLNFSLHFWVHLFSNSIFRKEIFSLICNKS